MSLKDVLAWEKDSVVDVGAGPEGLDSSTVGLQTNCWRVELGQSNSTPQPLGGGGAGQLSN